MTPKKNKWSQIAPADFLSYPKIFPNFDDMVTCLLAALRFFSIKKGPLQLKVTQYSRWDQVTSRLIVTFFDSASTFSLQFQSINRSSHRPYLLWRKRENTKHIACSEIFFSYHHVFFLYISDRMMIIRKKY